MTVVMRYSKEYLFEGSAFGMLYFSSKFSSDLCLYFDIEKQCFGTEGH